MNNYSMPPIIRIINKLDTIIGIASLSLIAYLFSKGENILDAVTPIIITLVLFGLWTIIILLKIASYIACIFQGYRVTLIGLILYCIWGLLVGITTILIAVTCISLI